MAIKRKYSMITEDIYDLQPDMGVVKMVGISEYNPTFNFGGDVDTFVQIRTILLGSTEYLHTVLEVIMPTKEDSEIDDISKLELIVSMVPSVNYGPLGENQYMVFGIVEIPDDFEQGTLSGAAGDFCTWQKKIDAVGWERGDGASESKGSVETEDGEVFDTFRIRSSDPYTAIKITLDLTGSMDFGDTKRFALFVAESDVRDQAAYKYGTAKLYNHQVTPTPPNIDKPVIRLTGRDYAPEGWDTEENKLKVIPNPDDPTRALFQWGAIDEIDLENYKIYYDFSFFNLPSTAILRATIADLASEEYADPTTIAENVITYYRIIAEDQNNIVDNALISNVVSFKRPDLIESESNKFINAGESVSINLQSGVPCKRVYVEWGDDEIGYWYESEEESYSFDLTHLYSAKGLFNIKARMESVDGFWSDLTDICNVTSSEPDPVAILVARPLEVIEGEIVRLNGSLSHTISSNGYISEYLFDIPGSSIPQADPVYNWDTTGAGTGTKQVRLRVQSDSVTHDTSPWYDIEIVTAEPELLVFSKDTKIESRVENRGNLISTSPIEGGEGEVDVKYGLTNIDLPLQGMSTKDNLNADLNIIRDAVDNYSFVRIKTFDEGCGLVVYYDCRIIAYRITKTTRRYATWRLDVRVLNRTEV